MSSEGVPIGIGTRFIYDGDLIEVVGVHSTNGHLAFLTKDVRAGLIRRFSAGELMSSDRSHLVVGSSAENVRDVASVALSALSKADRRKVSELAGHINEVLYGYRSGTAQVALPGEPRGEYLPHLPLGSRYAAKAAELGMGYRSVERCAADYRRHGEAGLVSHAKVRPGRRASVHRRWEVWNQFAAEVMIEHADLSRPTGSKLIAHTNARAIARLGEDVVRQPSPATAYRNLAELELRYPTSHGSRKSNRDAAERPLRPYGKLQPIRPGEYLLMDTTRLDVFGMDPQTLCWVGADLTVAMDWYSRCVVGMRVTPVSPKAIDVAGILYQVYCPPPAPRDWPEYAVWPPHGVPRAMFIEKEAWAREGDLPAASPAVVPETVVIDHGMIYLSDHLNSVCRRLGISIQPAHLRTGRDKGPLERFFLTLRTGLLQELPGYKGPDVYSRGRAPQEDAYYYLDELEAIIRKWIATVYHHRPHDGLVDPGLPSVTMTPAEMFDHGIARAGYIEAPRDPALGFEFLRTERRTIQHYGVDIEKRRYKGAILSELVNKQSPYCRDGRSWPFQVNPDDIRHIFIRHPETRTWHTVAWEHADLLDAPCSEDALAHARKRAKAKYRYPDDRIALADLLELLHLGQAKTRAERRTELRLSREESTLIAGLPIGDTEASELPSAATPAPVTDSSKPPSMDGGTPPDNELAQPSQETDEDELDEPPPDADDDFYADALEDI